MTGNNGRNGSNGHNGSNGVGTRAWRVSAVPYLSSIY